MNARVATASTGTITLLCGLAALVYPERALAFLGFTLQNASHAAAALGEVRATYGGIFIVLGAYTLLATANPVAHRARLVLLGLIWLGACAGRLFGVSVDGNPGLFGWLAAGFELVMGGTLLLASVAAGAPVEALSTDTAAPAPPAVGVSPSA